MPNALFMLVIVLAFAYALHTLGGLQASLTPLVSLVSLVNITVLFAMYGMLKTGVICACVLSVAAFAVAVYKNRGRLADSIKSFMTAGVILFTVSAIAMMAYLAYTQPLIHEWDELSFWGISQLLVKNNERLYTYYKSSMIGNSTPPALPVLSYFFQWLNPVFTEWIGYFAYDVLFFACYSAFTTAFEGKNANSAIFVYLGAFLLPFFFAFTDYVIFLKTVYISSYADVPLGIVTAGALAVYLFSNNGDSRDVLPVLSVLMFLTFIKDMGFALSCIVAFIAFFDMLVGRKQFSFLKIKGFFGKCAAAAAMLVTAAGSFLGWSAHMARVMQRNPFELGGETNMSQVQMLITGVKELLFGPQSEKFVYVKARMTEAFTTIKLSMIGSGIRVVAVISILFLLAIIFGDKNGRKRSAMMYATTIIGFVGYYVFHLFLYVYIFKDNAYTLTSYDRYINIYYIAWMLSAILAVCLAAGNGAKFWAKGVLTGFVCCILLLLNFYTIPENIFTGVSENSFHTRREIMAKADHIRDVVNEDDVIYIHCGQDDGMRWFMYTFEFADNYIIPNQGFVSQGSSYTETKKQQQREMAELFKRYGVTHVLVDWCSPDFYGYFDELFDVSVGNIGNVSIGYYKVVYTQDSLRFEQVKGGVVNFD